MIIEFENANHLHQLRRLTLQCLGGGSRFFHQCRVLLGYLVHLCNGVVDLPQSGRLLQRGCSDFANDVGNPFDATDNLVHCRAGLIDKFGAIIYLRHRLIDERLDFLGRSRGTRGQVAHLAGNNGETTTLLACAGRFNRGVQRENVGLERDAINEPMISTIFFDDSLIDVIVATTLETTSPP